MNHSDLVKEREAWLKLGAHASTAKASIIFVCLLPALSLLVAVFDISPEGTAWLFGCTAMAAIAIAGVWMELAARSYARKWVAQKERF